MIWSCPERGNCIPYSEGQIVCRSHHAFFGTPLDYRKCEIYQKRHPQKDNPEGPLNKTASHATNGLLGLAGIDEEEENG